MQAGGLEQILVPPAQIEIANSLYLLKHIREEVLFTTSNLSAHELHEINWVVGSQLQILMTAHLLSYYTGNSIVGKTS